MITSIYVNKYNPVFVFINLLVIFFLSYCRVESQLNFRFQYSQSFVTMSRYISPIFNFFFFFYSLCKPMFKIDTNFKLTNFLLINLFFVDTFDVSITKTPNYISILVLKIK